MEQVFNETRKGGIQAMNEGIGLKSEKGPPSAVADGKEVKISVDTDYLKCQHVLEILKYIHIKSVGQL